MRRGTFAVLLCRSLGIDPLPRNQQNMLPEDARGTNESGYIAALYQRGILRGTSSSSFSPDETVTRAMAATVFARAFNLSGGNTIYADVNPNHWAAGYINAATAAGLFRGTGDGLFNPDGDFTMEHLDIVLERANRFDLNVVGGSTSNTTPATPDAETEETIGKDAIEWSVKEIVNSFDLGTLTKAERDELEALIVEDFEEGRPEGWLLLAVEGTLAFDRRFGVALAGDNPYNYTASDIIAFEDQAKAMLRRSGLPETFYDTREELQQIMASGVDLDELESRIDLAYTTVMEAPLEVREWYATTFGIRGDDALAAMVFDPEGFDEVKLKDWADKAAVGGAGAIHGFTLGEQLAGRLADMGVDFGRGVTGFASIAELAPLFQETFGETEDFDELGIGVEHEFVGGEATRQLEKRRRSRLAAFSGSGGAAASDSGVVGLGSAE